MNLRKRMWEVLNVTRHDDKLGRAWEYFVIPLIVLNVIAVIVATVADVRASFGMLLRIFEVFSVAVFTVEYLSRIWSCTADPRFVRPITGRIRFIFQPMSLVDLLAILPFYIPFWGVDLRVLRILRMMRIVRLAKLARYSASLNLLQRVFHTKRQELIITSVIMLLLLVVSATVLFYCENSAQPDKFSSIPATMWWSVATLTTVGYGDMFPITAMGKVFGGIIAIIGIAMFALPTAVLGAGFVEALHDSRQPRKCPHCGKEL